jgi:hypothetical protein
MPRRNHSHRLRDPREGRFPEDSGGREDQGSEEPTAGYSDVAGRMGAYVERNTARTVLASFGLGFGLGLFVTLLFTRRESNWFERYAPEALQDLPETLGQLPERLKHVPESFASYVPSSWKLW